MYKLFTPVSDKVTGIPSKLVFIQELIFLEGIKSVLGQGGEVLE